MTDPSSPLVEMKYLGALRNLHFDDYAEIGSFFEPVSWLYEWPRHAEVTEVENAMLQAWPSRPFFCANSLVCFEFHDLSMVRFLLMVSPQL